MINRDALARQPLPKPRVPGRRRERRRPDGDESKVPAAAPQPYGAYFPIVIVAVLLAYLVVGRAAYIAELGYEISHVRTEVAAVQDDVRRLTVQRSGAASLAAVEEQATRTQGLLPPQVRWLAAAPPPRAPAGFAADEGLVTYVVDPTGVRSLSQGEEKWFDLQRRVAEAVMLGRSVEAWAP